jgi:hypothetical protein
MAQLQMNTPNSLPMGFRHHTKVGDDVVNLKWHAGELRRKAAVFAVTPGAAPNPRLQARVHFPYPFSV